MQILARYIAITYFRNLLLSLVGLTTLFFFQTVITQVNDFTLSQRILYTLFDVGRIWVMVAPPSTLMATVLTLSAFSKTNELIACFSIGISLRQIAGVIFPIVFVLCCLSLILQDRIIPALNQRQSLFYWREIKKRQDFYLDVKQEKIWYRSENLIYHLRNFDPAKGIIYGIGVYSFDPAFNLLEEIQADQAEYHSGVWRLTGGKTTRFPPEGGFPVTRSFQSRDLRIKETPADFKMIEREVDRLRIKDLLRFIRSNRKSGIDARGFEVKLQSRFSLSFMPLIMFLLAIPFAVSRSREGRTGRDLSIAFAITFVYWLSFSIGMSMGQKGTVSPVLAAWSPSVIFGLLAVFLLRRLKV
jgi:lipopolysaccharide export system permease protein